MHDEDEILSGALVHLVDHQQRERSAEQQLAERQEGARRYADEARLQLAELAAPAVAVIALRLSGSTEDWDGRTLNKEREDTAWEVLSRIGVPRLRATAVAASIVAQTSTPAPGSPGWEPDEIEREEAAELDPASVDAQIEAFIAGARAQRDIA
jgi:hypothetical protein